MKKVNQLVQNFILERIPDDLLRAYDVLAQLQYPINDRQSFYAMLSGNQQEGEDLAIELLTLLDVDAFPIASPQNALEKFHLRLPNVLQIVPIHSHMPGVPINPDIPPPVLPETEALPWWVRELLETWFRRAACLNECDQEFRRCQTRAGEDLGAQFRCIVQHHICRRGCGA